ncbi:MAG: glycosyltransferase family 4 protein [Solirubrobacterales bacterium]
MSAPPSPLIVIGPTPPPVHGSAVATKHLVDAVAEAGALAAHLETGEDDRSTSKLGALDPLNVYLGLKHVALLVWLLARNRGADIYVPISQNLWAFARDAIFIRLGALARRRVVVHLHGGYFGVFYAKRGPLGRRWIEGTFGRVDEAWVLTEFHRDIFGPLIAPNRVRVIENSSDDMGPPRVAARDDERLRLLFLSNLMPEKGHADLLAALESLAERGSGGIDLRLAGGVDPDVAARVRERAEALANAGIGVELLGRVEGERKREQFRWADALVLPSHFLEGQPIVLLEAMSAGLPIVASDSSGIPFTVLDGEQALIVGAGDIEALAAAIERLRDEPALRERLGRSGRERYEQRYTHPSFATRVAELLVRRAPPRRAARG